MIDKLNVLVLDDDFPSRRLLEVQLRDKYNVHCEEDIAGAKKYLKDHDIDIAIIDLALKLETGFDFFDYLQNHGRSKVRTIALTAHTMPTDREKCMNYGFNGFMRKPYLAEEMVAAIESAAENMGTA